MSFAHITVAGIVTNEPRVREVNTKQGARKVLSFSVATDHGWGERKESTFWNAEYWLPTEKAEGYMMHAIGKGARVCVFGEPYIHTFEANDGSRKTYANIDAKTVEIMKPCATEQDVTKRRDAAPQADPYGDDLPF